MLKSHLFELLNSIDCGVHSNDFPFGGVQLVFVGDFSQFLPIRSIYSDEHHSFESHWSICLTVSFSGQFKFRRSDPEFIKFLIELRYGKLSSESKQFFARLNRSIDHEINTSIGVNYYCQRLSLKTTLEFKDLLLLSTYRNLAL